LFLIRKGGIDNGSYAFLSIYLIDMSQTGVEFPHPSSVHSG